jgi:hypothetical protein
MKWRHHINRSLQYTVLFLFLSSPSSINICNITLYKTTIIDETSILAYTLLGKIENRVQSLFKPEKPLMANQ